MVVKSPEPEHSEEDVHPGVVVVNSPEHGEEDI